MIDTDRFLNISKIIAIKMNYRLKITKLLKIEQTLKGLKAKYDQKVSAQCVVAMVRNGN